MKPLNKLRDIEYKAYTLKYYKKSSVYISINIRFIEKITLKIHNNI